MAGWQKSDELHSFSWSPFSGSAFRQGNVDLCVKIYRVKNGPKKPTRLGFSPCPHRCSWSGSDRRWCTWSVPSSGSCRNWDILLRKYPGDSSPFEAPACEMSSRHSQWTSSSILQEEPIRWTKVAIWLLGHSKKSYQIVPFPCPERWQQCCQTCRSLTRSGTRPGAGLAIWSESRPGRPFPKSRPRCPRGRGWSGKMSTSTAAGPRIPGNHSKHTTCSCQNIIIKHIIIHNYTPTPLSNWNIVSCPWIFCHV